MDSIKSGPDCLNKFSHSISQFSFILRHQRTRCRISDVGRTSRKGWMSVYAGVRVNVGGVNVGVVNGGHGLQDIRFENS